jgi:hypothetical protein
MRNHVHLVWTKYAVVALPKQFAVAFIDFEGLAVLPIRLFKGDVITPIRRE